MGSKLALLLVGFLMVSCDPATQFEVFKESRRGRIYFSALAEAQSSAPRVVEFMRLFPKAEITYIYFTKTGEPGYNVSADLYDRYELTMQLPVTFDASRSKVIGYGEPKFYLLEITRVELLKGGGANMKLNPKGQRNFGVIEWETLLKNDGDFSSIDCELILNQPVPNFRDRKTNS